MDQYTENQRKLHRCHVLLLEEVKRICIKHDIRYFAIAGTLLGAVRHRGAIPWDDDMDLGMLRADYDRFLRVAEAELEDTFFLQNFRTDPGYGLNFSKLMLKNTVMIEKNAASNSAYKGIYVDIFPLDSAPDDAASRAVQNRKTYFIKRLFLAKQGYKVYESHETKKKIVYKVLSVMAAPLTKRKIYSLLEDAICRYNALNTEKIVNIGGAYGYEKETLLRQWFDGSVELQFEDTTINAPSGYREYLRYFYGDYMTPPPEDKRGDRHNIVMLDFGPYCD